MMTTQLLQSNAGGPIRRSLALLASAVVSFAATDASAQLFLIAGNHVLNPNEANQPVTIQVNNAGLTPVSVDTFTLFASIGEGGPSLGKPAVPVITTADLHSGTAFSANFSAEIHQETLPSGFAMLYVTTATSGTSVSIAPGLSTIATLTIDTTGFDATDGPWTFRLGMDVEGFGTLSSEYLRNTTPVAATLTDGSISLAAVPEPSQVAFLAGVGLIGFGVWRRFRSV